MKFFEEIGTESLVEQLFSFLGDEQLDKVALVTHKTRFSKAYLRMSPTKKFIYYHLLRIGEYLLTPKSEPYSEQELPEEYDENNE